MMHSVFVIFAVTFVGATAGGGSGSGRNTESVSKKPVGVGAYAYQDSNNNRYGGTYDIHEEDIPNLVYAPAFSWYPSNAFPGGFPFARGDDFFQGFFNNLQSPFQDPFHTNGGRQKSNSNPDMASNKNFHNIGEQYARAGMDFANQFIPGGFPNNFGAAGSDGNQASGGQFVPDFTSHMNVGDFQHPQGSNSAYAGASIGPDGTRQVASISPHNPNKPNIDISSRNAGGGGDGFYSVSASSYSSSSDNGGKRTESRGAKTVVNDNGVVKEYQVNN